MPRSPKRSARRDDAAPARSAARDRHPATPSSAAASTAARAPWTRPALLASAAFAALILVLHVRKYREFLADDALISLRYAHRLLEGHGLTWTDGPRVEGYSNLLWILVVALPGAIGIDLVTAARELGLALALLATVVVVMGAGRNGPSWAALAAGLTLAIAGPVDVWARAGLEPPLVLALLATALAFAMPLADPGAASRRVTLATSLALALLVLTRPDGAIFTVTLALGLLIARGFSRATLSLIARLVALPAAAYVAQLAFRLAYYHAWVPNSALVKIAFTPERVALGFRYLSLGFASFWPLWLLVLAAAIAALASPATRARAWIAIVPLLGWVGYVVAIGGDFFPGYRHLVPIFVPAAFLIALGLEAGWAHARARIPAVVAALALLLLFGSFQAHDRENTRAREEMWVWDGRAIGLMLKRGFGERQPLLAVTAAGCFPYWSELPSLDMLGLNDAEIPRLASPEFGKGWPGHELGDAPYVLRRAPDIIQFSGIRRSERTGYFRVEQELAKSLEFQRRYRLATFVTGTLDTARQALWLDLESPRIGIERTADRVRVPAYLLTDNATSTVTLDGNGRPGVTVDEANAAAFLRLSVPAGHWSAEIEADADRAVVAVRRSGGTDRDWTLVGSGAARVDGPIDVLAGVPRGSPVHVRAVVLNRATP